MQSNMKLIILCMGNGNIGSKNNFNKQNRNVIEKFINDLVCIKCLLF